MFRRTWIRWVSGLVVLVLVALAAVYAASQRRMDRRFEVTPTAVVVPSDAAALGEGLRLYFSRGCADCHGDDLGGKRVIDDLLAGMVFGANLTGGRGGLGERDDLDLVRAIRHGVAPDGRALLFMPAHEYNPLADAEIGAIIAAIRAAAPVDREAPPPRIGPLMRALFLFGEVPTLVSAEVIDHDAPRPAPPTVAPTAAYGAYLANLCVGCHGPGLSGGSIPGAPPELASGLQHRRVRPRGVERGGVRPGDALGHPRRQHAHRPGDAVAQLLTHDRHRAAGAVAPPRGAAAPARGRTVRR
jgi:mono/diheme cytochrome c family protein